MVSWALQGVAAINWKINKDSSCICGVLYKSYGFNYEGVPKHGAASQAV